MSKIRTAVMLAAGLALSACAMAPTPYQPSGAESRYGYSDEQVDAETWRVRFAGNSVTERGKVEDYLLYRSAEIALAAGADGFVVVKEDIEKDVTYYGAGYPFGTHVFHSYHFGHHRGHHSGIGISLGSTALRPSNNYTGHATIRLFRERAPEGLGPTYDARAVVRVLGPKILRPAEETG